MISGTSTRIVVTGVGTINPLGGDVTETWRNLLAGRSGIGPIRRFDAAASGLKTHIAGEVSDFVGPGFDVGQAVDRLDRCSQFAVVAAREALLGARLAPEPAERAGLAVVLGSAFGGVGTLDAAGSVLRAQGSRRVSPLMFPKSMGNAAAAAISLYCGARGPALAINSACASAADAIGLAADLIRAGRARMALAGGSEAAILPLMLAALERMGAVTSRYNAHPTLASRPFERDRDGFVIAEGAAMLVLERADDALRRGAPLLAELAGYGSTSDAHHLTAPAPDGRGALGAMHLALADAGELPDAIRHINAHGTSTRLNDAIEAQAIRTLLGVRAQHVPVTATKSASGHMGGATGALEALLCVQSCRTGLAPPTLNYDVADPECALDIVSGAPRRLEPGLVLSNAFGFGGHCACLAFRPL